MEFKKIINNGTVIPNECPCIWCGGTMKIGGGVHVGSGTNEFTLWCHNCGAIVHHAHNSNKQITGFKIEYNFENESEWKENMNQENQTQDEHIDFKIFPPKTELSIRKPCICSECQGIMYYDPYFAAYTCSKCGTMKRMTVPDETEKTKHTINIDSHEVFTRIKNYINGRTILTGENEKTMPIQYSVNFMANEITEELLKTEAEYHDTDDFRSRA